MGVYFDGERSRQRYGFARSMLNKLKMLGGITKTILFDGFLYRVQIIAKDLHKIMITAPMGAAAMCAHPGGVKVMHADHWINSFSPGRGFSRPNFFLGGSPAWWVYYAFSDVGSTPIGLNNGATLYPGGLEYPNTLPTPSMLPWSGELMTVSFTGRVTGIAYMDLVEAHMYSSVGGMTADTPPAPIKRLGVSNFSTSLYSPPATIQHLPSLNAAIRLFGTNMWQYRRDLNTNMLIAGSVHVVISDGGGSYTVGLSQYTCDLMFTNVPAWMKPILLNTTIAYSYSMGSYGFALQPNHGPTLLHITNATNVAFASGYGGNPADEVWKITGCIYNGVTGTITNFPLIPFMEAAFGVTIGTDSLLATTYALQLCGWPNDNRYAPYDSAMFHDQYGDIYSWTRKYGAFKFNDSIGLQVTFITVPTLVSANEGIRPEIYYCGESNYYCSCYEEGYGVREVYIGSPHGAWTGLQSPPFRLLQVRCASYVGTKHIFLGVMYDDAKQEYWFGHYDSERTISPKWMITGKLNIGSIAPENTQWAMTLYGNGKYTIDMLKMPAAPPATPQRGIGQYADYATYQP